MPPAHIAWSAHPAEPRQQKWDVEGDSRAQGNTAVFILMLIGNILHQVVYVLTHMFNDYSWI